MTTKQILTNALALLGENGERWCKKHFVYKDKHCVAGAIRAVSEEAGFLSDVFLFTDSPAYIAMSKIVGESRLSKWNDSPDRTWPEVKAAFKRAIEACEEAGNGAVQSITVL